MGHAPTDWRRAALAALAALPWACGAAEPAPGGAAQAPDGARELRRFAVELHAHGTSELGPASLDALAREAADAGLDAVWVVDHERHLAGSGAPCELSFEGDPAPALRPLPQRSTVAGEVRLSELRAFDGERSFEVSAAGAGAAFEDYVAELEAPFPSCRRPLGAGVALEFALWIEGAGPDARAWVEAELAEHPAGGGGFAPASVRYVVGAPEREPWREGAVLWVPLRGVERAWRAYRAELSLDAARGFPEREPLDDTLTAIRVGLSARNGAAITAFVDGVRVGAERSGAALLELEEALLAGVARRHPGLALHQGLGIECLGAHWNLFAPRAEAFDADAELRNLAFEREAGRSLEEPPCAYLARRATLATHARGGLVSLSPRAERREALLAELLESRLHGADLLELGAGDRGGPALQDHLWVWDRLALEGGLYPVGIGTGDRHGARAREAGARSGFVSWITARSSSAADLLEGLRAGRVAFGDPARFGGALELATDRGQAMGRIVVTDRDSVALEIAVDGLAATDRVVLVESGERTRELAAGGGSFRAREALALPPEGGFARVEVRDRDGAAIALSNPIHFLRRVPEGGLDPSRAAFDVAGVASVDLGGFELAAVEALGEGRRGVRVGGRGQRAALVLDCSGLAAPVVELEGLRAKVVVEGSRVRLEGLLGQGRVVVRGDG